MKISFVLFAALAFAVACDRTSKPLPDNDRSAQAEAAQYELKCEGPCHNQVGLMVGKVGARNWTCTAFVVEHPDSVLVANACVEPIVNDGGGCVNKLTVRFAGSANAYICDSVSAAGPQYSRIHFRESIAAAGNHPTDVTMLTTAEQLNRVGFRVEGYQAVQESKECKVVTGSLLNPTRHINQSSAALLHGCANPFGMRGAGILDGGGALLTLVDDHSARLLKGQSLLLSGYNVTLDIADLSLTTAMPALLRDQVVMLDTLDAIEQMRGQITQRLLEPHPYFEFSAKRGALLTGDREFTLVPVCIKELAFTELNHRAWRGLTRAASGGISKQLNLPVWLMGKTVDSVGRPMMKNEMLAPLPMDAIITKPTADGMSATVDLYNQDRMKVWSSISLPRCQ